MESSETTQKEMKTKVAERNSSTGCTHDIPSGSDQVYNFGNQILMYYEKEKKCDCPLIVDNVECIVVAVQTFDGLKQPLSTVFQVKPF